MIAATGAASTTNITLDSTSGPPSLQVSVKVNVPDDAPTLNRILSFVALTDPVNAAKPLLLEAVQTVALLTFQASVVL